MLKIVLYESVRSFNLDLMLVFLNLVCRTCCLTSNRTYADDVQEQRAMEGNWTKETGSNRKM